MATNAGSVRGRARFAAACGVLSRYVKEAAEKAAAAETTEARSVPMVALPLMPGADLSTTTQEEQEPATSCAAQAQMTIFYGGRVLVLDAVDGDRAAELLRLAATGAGDPAIDKAPQHGEAVLPAAGSDLLPVARKASLQRFMEKRKGRVAARATPYSQSQPDGEYAWPADRLKLAL